MIEFHALHRDPLKCDSNGRWGLIHHRSVSPLHPSPCFARDGGIPDKQSFHVSAVFPCNCPPLPPVISYPPSVPPEWHVPAF